MMGDGSHVYGGVAVIKGGETGDDGAADWKGGWQGSREEDTCGQR